MDLQVEVLKIELKDTPSFELRCKAETNSNERLMDSVAVNLNGEVPQRSNLTRSKTRVRIQQPHVAKFRFRFKKPSPVAALLFTAIGYGAATTSNSTLTAQSAAAASARGGTSAPTTSIRRREPGEIGQCFFPITFRPEDNKALGSLAVKAAALANQTQTGFITTKVEGMNINKVVGRILFTVVNQKSVPKKLLQQKTSYLDLRMTKENFAKPVKSGPSLDDLIARERASLCKATFMPGVTPTVTVVFHCAASAKQDLLTDLRPIACIGASPDVREDSFFKDNSDLEVRVVSTLKPITLQCSGNADKTNKVLELHLSSGSGNKVPFSAAHTLQTFYPFKHYHWEYNWRWLPGTQTNTLDSFQSNGKESKVILSVVYTPSTSDFASYEGLEVLIQEVDLSSFSRDQNLIACVQLVESIDSINFGFSVNTSPLKQQAGHKGAESTYNFNVAVMQFSPAGGGSEASSASGTQSAGSKIVQAYFFFAVNPFFRSKFHDHRLQISLYSVDKESTSVWWKESKIASSSIPLPAGLKKILPRPENQGGVRCNLLDSDIIQPEETPIVNKMTIILRWKAKEVKFLSSAIENSLDKLPLIQDLDYSLPETEVASASSSKPPTAISQVYLEEYKTAITKMGLDILKLRQENQQLSEENKRLERHMIEMEASIVVTAADHRTLQPLSKADLIHRVVELSEHLTNEQQSRKGYQDKVRTLHNQLIEKNDIVTQHVQLQEAHEAQQKLVRQLQSKVEKYRKCCETSRKQESVINQLEALLALEAGDRRAGNALSIISKENADLRAMLREHQDSDPDRRRSLLGEKDGTISSLRKELERLSKQCQNLEEQLSGITEKNADVNSGTLLEQKTKIYELEQKLRVAEARESTLMKELEDNGRKWAQEKARYEIKLTQLKTRLEAMTARGAEIVNDQSVSSPLSLAPSRPLLAQSSQSNNASSTRDGENQITSHNRTRASALSGNQSTFGTEHYSLDDRISF